MIQEGENDNQLLEDNWFSSTSQTQNREDEEESKSDQRILHGLQDQDESKIVITNVSKTKKIKEKKRCTSGIKNSMRTSRFVR